MAQAERTETRTQTTRRPLQKRSPGSSLPPLFAQHVVHTVRENADLSQQGDAFIQAATAFPDYAPRTQVNVTSVAENPAILPGLMADIMEQIGDALALVDDAGMTSASEAWAPPTAATPASQAREPRLQWSPNTEPQVPIAEQLLSPAAQHRSELARHFAQAAAVAFATPAAAASYTPPPLPAHKYPHITRSSFAGHVTRLRQARVAAGLPPVPPRAVADTPPKSAVGGQPSGAAAPAATATAASHVPAMFFSREFRLSSAKSFACVLSGEFGATLGSQQSALDDTAASQQLATAALRDTHAAAPTISSLRVSPALQHTLTNYLDFVEGDLASRITGRKEQLFNALHTLHTLWNSVVVANNAVVATKERVARSRAVLSQQALRLLALRQRQSRAKALKQKLLQLRELATQKKSIVRMLSRGSHASALAACRALRASVQQAAQGSLRCASSLLEAIASLEAATADAVSKQFNSDAMGVISGALDASSALHVLSRGSLSSAAAAAVRAYVQGWQASHSAQAATAESGSDSSSLLQVLAWSGPLGCEAALLQFVLRRQLGTLGSLGAGTMQACLETLSGKVVREVKALITTEVCEGVRVLQLREAASAAWAAEGGAAETPGSNPFEYDWESVGGDSVSISTVQCLAFSDFCDMLVSLLVSLHRCLRRVARLHNLVQQVAHNLAQSPLENTATPPITADDAAIVSLLSRDVVVSAAGTAQKQVAKLLRARRAVHGSLKVSHMGALMAVCDAFAHSCASLTHEASSSGSASPPGEAELAVGGSELMLEAATQVRSAMKTLHTRNMTSLPALLDAEVWKAVSVQPAFHALVLDLCAPGLLGSAAVNQALPSLRRTLAAQSSTIADELASGTLARLGESVSSDKTASGAVLLSALGQALPLRCVAEWPQLRTAAEASTLKLEVHLDGPSVKAMPCSAGTPPSLVTQQPPPPATQRLHVPVDAASGVKVVHSEATHAHMQVDVLPFTVVGAALMLLKMMEDYVSAARLMPHAISGDAATKLAELLRVCTPKCDYIVPPFTVISCTEIQHQDDPAGVERRRRDQRHFEDDLREAPCRDSHLSACNVMSAASRAIQPQLRAAGCTARHAEGFVAGGAGFGEACGADL